MSSGARFEEKYDGKDDLARFTRAAIRDGVEGAAKIITERQAPQGTRFSYASAETEVLAAVMRGATGTSVSEYLTTRLWQAIGAETSSLWLADKTGLERAAGNFNATLRDYARLGIVLLSFIYVGIYWNKLQITHQDQAIASRPATRLAGTAILNCVVGQHERLDSLDAVQWKDYAVLDCWRNPATSLSRAAVSCSSARHL